MDMMKSHKTPSKSECSSTAKKVRTRKRKCSDDLPENLLEVEKNLQAAAIKNNLDEASVKKILKKVVTNDHVLALVKLREEEEALEQSNEDDDSTAIPKLTRSKVKELKKVSPKSAWNLENLELSPIKHIPVKTRPEVKALIAQELSDDEDDEEYKPSIHDIPSDDDHTESCSDLDLTPRTPATPLAPPISPAVTDGPFKVPQNDVSSARRRLDVDEKPAIALRTRSKLSLSSTTIEHIESSFVPPDEVPLTDVDDLWSEFLTECLNPASNARNEEDDETDPEYNVAADPDAHDEDEEALESSIVKISKKELNDLVTELFHIMPEEIQDSRPTNKTNTTIDSSDTTFNNTTTTFNDTSAFDTNNVSTFSVKVTGHWEGKHEPRSDDEQESVEITRRETYRPLPSIGKTEPVDDTENDVNCQNTANHRQGLVDHRQDSIEHRQETAKRRHAAKEMKSVEKSTSQCRNIQPRPPSECNSAPQTVNIVVEERNTMVETPPDSTPAVPKLLLKSIQLRTPNSQTVEVRCLDSSEPYMTSEQVLIMQQQLRQHVQLCASHFLQLYIHPVHWSLAPHYKTFLESFEKMTQGQSRSIAEVCNLKPALDLVRSWEKSLSEDTPENREIVEFIQRDIQKERRRANQNSAYSGEFHDTFKRVVVNSSVFLYPQLLPPQPFKAADSTRRMCYLKSEDRLIALGLDQFWSHVEANPEIFKRPQKCDTRTRWGYRTAVELTTKVMFPWMAVRPMMAHVRSVQRAGDPDNPIVKFLKHREIERVNHKILPVDPSRALVHHPLQEIPIPWLKYLAKTNKKAKDYLADVNKLLINGIVLPGEEMRRPDVVVNKKPLPSDFTKIIKSTRINSKSEIAYPIAVNGPQLTPLITINPQTTNQQNLPDATVNPPTLTDKSVDTDGKTDTSQNVQNNFYQVVQTSTGLVLLPLTVVNTQQTTNVGSDVTNEKCKDTQEVVSAEDEAEKLKHCKCCKLYRRITQTQRSIKHYFKHKTKDDVEQPCPCTNIAAPSMSSRLKLLVTNFKSHYHLICKDLDRKIKSLMNNTDVDESTDKIDDIVFVNSFLTKLLSRTVISLSKRKHIYQLFASFDLENGSPLALTKRLGKLLDNSLVDIAVEFLGFLTPIQAVKMKRFKEYFVLTCVPGIVKKIESLYPDKGRQVSAMYMINSLILRGDADASYFNTPCDVCFEILNVVKDKPDLVRYVFDMFPHKAVDDTISSECEETPETTNDAKTKSNEKFPEANTAETPEKRPSVAAVEYEADHSSNDEEEEASDDEREKAADTDHAVRRRLAELPNTKDNETTNNNNNNQMTMDESHRDQYENDSSDMSMMIMSEDEEIKEEPLEWTKEEDKTILQVLKEYLDSNSECPGIEVIHTVVKMLAECLENRSCRDIEIRVEYLLDLLGTAV